MATPGLYIDTNTLQVGIGTTRPREAFHVQGNLLSTGNITSQGTVTASNLSILGDFVTLNTITSNTEQMVIQNAGTGPALKVTQTGANSIAEFYDDGNMLAMTIADGGNVGIGTAIPLGKLEVNVVPVLVGGDPTHKGDIRIVSQGGGSILNGTGGIEFKLSNSGLGYGWRINAPDATGANEGTPLSIQSRMGSATWTNNLIIKRDGNVGIGTVNPQATLVVYGNGQASYATFNTSTLGGTLRVCDSASAVNNGGAVVFGTFQGNFAAIKSSITDGTTNTIGHLSFYTRNTITDSTLTNRMTILNTGNVGIGTLTPQATLHVNGNILFESYAFYFTAVANTVITLGNPIPFSIASPQHPYQTITNSGFRAPASGLYLFVSSVNLDNASQVATWRGGIHKSSTNVTNLTFSSIISAEIIAGIHQEYASAALFNATFSVVAYCNINDYVKVFIIPGSSTTLRTYSWLAANNQFSGYRIM